MNLSSRGFSALGLIASVLLVSSESYAFPALSKVTPAQRAEMENSFSASSLNALRLNAAADFEGIIALSNCSGSLVRFTSSRDDDKAMVLTNGHCTGGIFGGLMAPGIAYINKSDTRSMTVLNPKDGASLGKISATKILYATMTGTDMALFEMKPTYREILTKYKVRPLTLSELSPDVGTKIDIVSGYWKRAYACSIDKIVLAMQEDKYSFTESVRYSQPGCETIGGTSGSPIIEAGTRDVVGVNNTGNESGELCTMNNPCELDSAGKKTAIKGKSYGQQTAWVYGCLNGQNKFDFTIRGCRLVSKTR